MRYQYGLTDARVFGIYDNGRVIATVAGCVDGTGREAAMQYADDIATGLEMLAADRRRRENPRDRQQSLI